jgi:hypothetical protein
VELVEGPNSTDLRESLLSTALLAADSTYDLVYLDVTWTAKFAAAGWLQDLSADFDAASRGAIIAAALAAGIHQGRLYRLPIRTDVGCLPCLPGQSFGSLLVDLNRDHFHSPGPAILLFYAGTCPGVISLGVRLRSRGLRSLDFGPWTLAATPP